MEAKKATKTVGQQKTPLGWSKSGRVAGKGNAMDSIGGSISSSSGSGSDTSSRLEDSALLISPPNQVMVVVTGDTFLVIMVIPCTPHLYNQTNRRLPSQKRPHDPISCEVTQNTPPPPSSSPTTATPRASPWSGLTLRIDSSHWKNIEVCLMIQVRA